MKKSNLLALAFVAVLAGCSDNSGNSHEVTRYEVNGQEVRYGFDPRTSTCFAYTEGYQTNTLTALPCSAEVTKAIQQD